MKTWIKRLSALAGVAVLAGAGGLAWYGNQPLRIEPLPKTINVTPGTHLKSLSAMLEREGVIGNARVFWLLGRVLGKAGTLKVGVYTLDTPLTPLELYAKIQRGEVSQAMVQFIEGWNWREVRAALAAQPMLKNDSAGMSDAELLRAIGAAETHPEGLLFPDTYFYAPHSSDLGVLRRAYRLQHEKLRAAWETRAPGLPYRTPYEALIMASIVKKET
ncbi:MAG TPA: aminodeoxychorismate lyase, partial [Thiobacillus sp.]|nr:aminodeoxychorismate lyase [Thiobacillus sp.]